MPGYSGTPLPKKLGIKAGFRVRMVNAPEDVCAELASDLAECEIKNSRSELDFAMLFVRSRKELDQSLLKVADALAPAGMLWVSWPKKSSGILTDVTENDIRTRGLSTGLVDVKVCAVTEIWSGLKFVRRLKDRAKAAQSAAKKR